ncbi:MAG TPA: sigma-70 family RNA polymerase sigma factor [Gemmatimonadales bacterium]|nr:sigma-70 family RNA polymerase sigma factor [Gemmatimonadales bacterium]
MGFYGELPERTAARVVALGERQRSRRLSSTNPLPHLLSYIMTDDRRPTASHSTGSIGPAAPADDPDHVLLERMARGETGALAVLYDRRAERVHTVAYWIVRDADEAEDVVEETFWQAWRTAGRYDSRRSSALTWLLMIARSRALDRLRTLRRRTEWAAAPGTTTSVIEELLARGTHDRGGDTEERFHVSAALGELPPEQREAVELAFFAGLSHSEIATRISQPLGTVKTRIRLAMQKLRERLDFLREDRS